MHPFDGLPFECRQFEPNGFVFVFDVSRSQRYRGNKTNANTGMIQCAMTYPEIVHWTIYFPNADRMIIQIWRTP